MAHANEITGRKTLKMIFGYLLIFCQILMLFYSREGSWFDGIVMSQISVNDPSPTL